MMEEPVTVFKYTAEMMLTACGQGFWAKSFRCRSVYDETCVKSLFHEGLQDYIQSTVQTWWRSKNKAHFHTLAANTTVEVDLGGKSEVPGSNRGNFLGWFATHATRRIRSTGATIDTWIGSEFWAEDRLDPFSNDLLLLRGGSQVPSAASGTRMGTDTTYIDDTTWCRLCMADEHVTSQCAFVRTNPA